MVKIDDKIRKTSFLSTADKPVALEGLRSKYVVLFFYPRANTPGCTKESIAFSEHLERFVERDCVVFGVSADSLKKQQNFKAKYDMKVDLIADVDELLCNSFEVIKEKNMYGRKFMGIVRSTFILSSKGEVLFEWRKVKVDGHVDEVLQKLKELG